MKLHLQVYPAAFQLTAQNPSFGILPFIFTSVYGTAGAVILGVPIGVMTAVFISKSAPPAISMAMRSAVQLLAGISSVVYGLVGMIILVPKIQKIFSLSSGATLLAAIIVLTIMILPSIINVSANALDPISTEKIENLCLELKKKYTVIMVTHNISQAKRISDMCAFFLLGELVEFGSGEQVFNNPFDSRTADYVRGRFG